MVPIAIPAITKSMKEAKKIEKSGVYQQVLHPPDFTKKATYVNITIRDASDAVYNKVHTALRRINLAPKLLPKLKGRVADKIATEASRRVPPSQVAVVLSEKLPKLLMYQMFHKHGMTISAQTVFIENAYIVLQLQVLHVDAQRLLANTTSTTSSGVNEQQDISSSMDAVDMKLVDLWMAEQQQQLLEAADRKNSASHSTSSATEKKDSSDSSGNWLLQTALGFLPEMAKTRLEGTTLPELVQDRLTERMQGLLVQQLSNKQLCGEIAVLPEEEQARFFFAYLQQHRKRQEDQKQKNLRQRRF